MWATQIKNLILSRVEKSQVSVTSEIDSEKEYKIVKLSDMEEDKLSEN